jgi:hypothetical protein
MGVVECRANTICAGGDNLMFWLIDNGSVGLLTSEQGRIMRANPAIY